MKLTDEEVLAEVEVLIEDFRYARKAPALQEHKTYHALKTLAAEVRGRQKDRVSEAHRELEAALAAVERSKTALGYGEQTLLDLAYKTRAYWPTIKQALEFFEDARKVDAQ